MQHSVQYCGLDELGSDHIRKIDRVRHGYGNTCGVLEMGPAGMGMVSKMPTRGYTATCTTVSWVCTGIAPRYLI